MKYLDPPHVLELYCYVACAHWWVRRLSGTTVRACQSKVGIKMSVRERESHNAKWKNARREQTWQTPLQVNRTATWWRRKQPWWRGRWTPGNNILEHAIDYCLTGSYRLTGSYPPGLSKDKKRAVRKRAKAVTVVKGEVYLQRRKNKVYAYDFHELISSTCYMLTMITFRWKW